MKRFFDLSTILMLPFFLLFTASENTVDPNLTISADAVNAHALISEYTDIELSLEEVQEIMNGETMDAIAGPCPGLEEGDCYPQSYLRKFLAYFGCCGDDCSLAICFDSNDDGCLTATDLTAFLANVCTE